jgi:hypothetical protein
MVRPRLRLAHAFSAIVISLGLAMAGVSTASAMQDKPDCMQAPDGGCSTGPYNGSGGGGWNPSLWDIVTNYSVDWVSSGSRMVFFAPINGAGSPGDGSALKSWYGLSSCAQKEYTPGFVCKF